MKKKFILFIISFVWACVEKQESSDVILNDERKLYRNNFTFILNNIKEFILDDETVNLINYIQYIDADSLNSLSILNEYNNSIYFYDYRSSDLLHVLRCNKSIVGNVQGYLYLNKDSVFIYSYRSGSLFCIDSKSNIFLRHRIAEIPRSSDKKIFPYSYVTTFTPLRKYRDKIISIGFVTGETSSETSGNRPVISLFDLKNKINEFVVNYPEMYVKYNWGGGFTYRLPYYEQCSGSIVVSFPASHHLVKYVLHTGRQTSYYAGSAAIEYLKPFSYSKDTPIDEEKAWEWYMNNPSYEGILYDKYLDRYYRIARLPVTKFNKDEVGNNKPIVIIILDNNLQYIGEVKLPENIRFFPSNCFVSKDGFNIQVLTDNEDRLTFYQYNFITNEKD